jgi:phosphoribosylformimino-5-aminoimidazole carboxamide ribotide isomerase
MLIPSIDLMGGKIVQLVQGERKALEFDDFDYWIERFGKYPLVQLIDLDAAMGTHDNRSLLSYFAQRLPCQVGGGIRSIDAARRILKLGAKKIIVGSSLVCNGKIDTGFAARLASAVGQERLVFAVDSKRGTVTTNGWKNRTEISPVQMIQVLEPWCDAFLYTHIESEGLMQGFPVEVIRQLRTVTENHLIAAGGISTNEEIAHLDSMNVDAVVGMAIYTSRLNA